MRERFEPWQSENAAGELDGVNKPENVVQDLGVVCIPLERTNSTSTISRLSLVSVRNSRSRSSMIAVSAPGEGAAAHPAGASLSLLSNGLGLVAWPPGAGKRTKIRSSGE